MRERSSCRLENRTETLEHAVGLFSDVVGDKLTGRWVKRNLARDKEELAGANGLGIGTNGGGCAIGTNSLHGS